MSKRPYRTHPEQETLRDLIAFANGEVDVIPRRDWIQQVPGLAIVMAVAGLTSRTAWVTAGRERLRDQLRAFFTAIATGRRIPDVSPISITFVPMPGHTPALGVRGQPSDVVRYHAVVLTQLVGPERVQQCPAATCQKLFVKVGRRKYCSDRCQTKEFSKEYYKPARVREREAKEEGKDVHTTKRSR